MRTKISLGQVTRPARKMTRDELLATVEGYVTHRLHYSPKGARATMQGVRYLVDHYGVGGKPLTVKEGEAIRDDLAARMRPRAVNLKCFYYELIAESIGQHDDYGPGLWIRKLRRTKPVNDYFTMDERDRMIRSCDNLRDRAVLWVGFSCGPRPDELCHIEVTDVEFSKRCIVIRDHGQGIKNGVERRAYMNDACMAAVRSWLDVRPLVESRRLFLNKYGHPFSIRRLRVVVDEAASRAGITRRHYPYMLRHSCATHILQAGGSVADAALQLGDTIETVSRHYAHGDARNLERVVRKL